MILRRQLPEIRAQGYIDTTCDACGKEFRKTYRTIRQRFGDEGVDSIRVTCGRDCARKLAVDSTKLAVDIPFELEMPEIPGMEGLKVAAAIVQETILRPRNIGILRKTMQAQFIDNPILFVNTYMRLLQDQMEKSEALREDKVTYTWADDPCEGQKDE